MKGVAYMYMQKVLVPDVLPNNLRAIRELKGLSLKDLAEELLIDRNFLGTVEMWEKNFSGKTAIRTLKVLGVSFYQLYNIAGKRKLLVTKPDREDPVEVEFDINLSREEDIKTADILTREGFKDTVVTWEEEIDGKIVKISKDRVYLDKSYKIPVGDDMSDFEMVDFFSIEDKRKKFIYDKDDDINPVSVRFKAIRPALNNLEKIRKLLNISVEQISFSLDLAPNAYLQLEKGNQKASLKVMWKLVRFLKLPLELIINIDEYYEKFCKNDAKITKSRNN